jgi:hypothetical protein
MASPRPHRPMSSPLDDRRRQLGTGPRMAPGAARDRGRLVLLVRADDVCGEDLSRRMVGRRRARRGSDWKLVARSEEIEIGIELLDNYARDCGELTPQEYSARICLPPLLADSDLRPYERERAGDLRSPTSPQTRSTSTTTATRTERRGVPRGARVHRRRGGVAGEIARAPDRFHNQDDSSDYAFAPLDTRGHGAPLQAGGDVSSIRSPDPPTTRSRSCSPCSSGSRGARPFPRPEARFRSPPTTTSDGDPGPDRRHPPALGAPRGGAGDGGPSAPARALRAAVSLQRGGHPRLDIWRQELEQVASALGIYSRSTRFLFIALGSSWCCCGTSRRRSRFCRTGAECLPGVSPPRAAVASACARAPEHRSTAEAVEQPFEKHEAIEAGWQC